MISILQSANLKISSKKDLSYKSVSHYRSHYMCLSQTKFKTNPYKYITTHKLNKVKPTLFFSTEQNTSEIVSQLCFEKLVIGVLSLMALNLFFVLYTITACAC